MKKSNFAFFVAIMGHYYGVVVLRDVMTISTIPLFAQHENQESSSGTDWQEIQNFAPIFLKQEWVFSVALGQPP